MCIVETELRVGLLTYRGGRIELRRSSVCESCFLSFALGLVCFFALPFLSFVVFTNVGLLYRTRLLFAGNGLLILPNERCREIDRDRNTK